VALENLDYPECLDVMETLESAGMEGTVCLVDPDTGETLEEEGVMERREREG